MNQKREIQEFANSMDADPKIIQELGSLSTQNFLISTLVYTIVLEGALLLIHRHFENRVDLQRHRGANDRIRSFIKILVEKFPEEIKTIPDKLVNPVQRVTYIISDPPVTGPVTATTMQLAHKTLKHLRAALALVVTNCETMVEAAKVGLYGFDNLKFLSEYFESLKID